MQHEAKTFYYTLPAWFLAHVFEVPCHLFVTKTKHLKICCIKPLSDMDLGK